MTVRFEPTKTQKIVQPIACGLLASAVVAGCVKALGKDIFEARWAGLSAAGGVGAAAVRWLTFTKGPFMTVKAREFFVANERKEKVQISAVVDGEKRSWQAQFPVGTEGTMRIRRTLVELGRAGVKSAKEVSVTFGGTYRAPSIERQFPLDHPVTQELIAVWTALIDCGDLSVERPNFARWMEQVEVSIKDGLHPYPLWNAICELSLQALPDDRLYTVLISGGKEEKAEVRRESTLRCLIDMLDLKKDQELWYRGVNLSAFEKKTHSIAAFGIDGTAPLEIRSKTK